MSESASRVSSARSVKGTDSVGAARALEANDSIKEYRVGESILRINPA